MTNDDEVKAIRRGVEKANSLAAKVGLLVIGLLIGVVLGIAGLTFFQNYNPPDKQEGPDVLAASVVFERVQSQNELVCASQKYNITEKAGSSNVIPFTDIPIPFTDNSFWYRYVGEIKVSVNLESAKFDQNGSAITITLDPPAISSNTPDMEKSGVLEENNNIFNPIHIEDVDAFRESCVELSEIEAYEGGIIEEARHNAEQNITGMFNVALGDEYTVKFIWRDQQ